MSEGVLVALPLMLALRRLSERPELVVDDLGQVLVAPPAPGQLGPPGSTRLGRDRLVSALPLSKSGHAPVLLAPAQLLVDYHGLLFGDAQGNLLGTPKIVVHRMLAASRSPQTRR